MIPGWVEVPLAFAAFFVAVVLFLIAHPKADRMTGDDVVEMVARGSKLGHLPREVAMPKARRWVRLGHYFSLAATAAFFTFWLWAIWTWG